MKVACQARRHWLGLWILYPLVVFALIGLCATKASAAKGSKSLPSLAAVEKAVSAHFSSLPGFQPNDIITQGDAKPVFTQLKDLGWKVADEPDILKQILAEDDELVRVLRSPTGTRFMRKVSKERNIYDRLDRVAKHKGGPAMLQRITSLPDGEKYAKADTGLNPNLSDLVLINDRGNAQTRKLKDFEKPTGSIYTAADFLERLKESHRKAGRAKR